MVREPSTAPASGRGAVRRLALPAGLAAALVAGAVAAIVALAGGGDGERAPARAASAPAPAAAPAAPAAGTAAHGLTADRFDSARAWAELRRQVAIGPRPAGSPQLRRLARRLRRALPHGRYERVPGHPGLRNVVGRIPGRRPAIVVAAHYDTKDLPGFVGANDGAAGTAAVLELARGLRRAGRPAGAREIRFVLFDGEEATDDTRPFTATGVRGSTAYARRHHRALGALVLLDFVAARDMRMRREASSDPALWAQLRRAARGVGAQRVFPPGTGDAITDDHTPFLARGVPAIDLIAWPYACWHETCDDLGAVSEGSLDATGETVLRLVSTLAR